MNEAKFTEGFCRACLVKYEDPLDLIQYSERNRRLFIYVTGLQVKRNDAFIFQLCKDCSSLLRTASQFKKKCKTSDKRFRNFMGLRNAGEDIDFCNFLKNNDYSHTFRLPFMSGNSTPAFHKTKDDDNVSTCTSIRNFMTDILKDDEIPDTEARIIKEVIEEEADISEDSLDSQWLQDEMSINEDFSTLDFSFSPFSTPKAEHRFQSPKLDLFPEKTLLDVATTEKSLLNDTAMCEKLITQTDNVIEIPEKPKYELNYYTASKEVTVKCPIVKKMDLALKNKENKLFSLDDLLKSPAACRGKILPGAETPTIHNILFGKTLDTTEVEVPTKQVTDLQILDTNCEENSLAISDFSFELPEIQENKEPEIQEYEEPEIQENEESEEVNKELSSEEIAKSCDVKKLHCQLCDIKFKLRSSLVIHFRYIHNHVIETKRRRIYMCDLCGRTLRDRTNLIKHLKTHEAQKSEAVSCSICSLKFVKKYNLKTHMATHQTLEERASNKNTETNFICPICGKSFANRQNLSTHKRRHGENFKYSCDTCELGFFRKYDHTVHMRTHTGEKTYACDICDKKFSRCDTLNRHHKRHLGDTQFKCEHCGKRFIASNIFKNHLVKSKRCQKFRASKISD